MERKELAFVSRILPANKTWPQNLAGGNVEFLDVIGDCQNLNKPMVALFCSSTCSGSAILASMKWVGQLAAGTQTVISGFHSAVEKSFLEVLLTGDCPIIICPPRSLTRYRIPTQYSPALKSKRLSIISNLPESVRTNSAASSMARNRLVAALATEIVITHASDGSKTEQFALELLGQGKNVSCLDPNCETLMQAGARRIPPP